jgi:hypothetical protein
MLIGQVVPAQWECNYFGLDLPAQHRRRRATPYKTGGSIRTVEPRDTQGRLIHVPSKLLV